MSTAAVFPVAKKQPNDIRDRLDLRIDPDLNARLASQAERFGVSVSAYVRQAAAERLERDEATDPRLKSKR